MKIIVGFTENGTPKTGLTPTMDIWESDGTHVINAAAMTEIAGGGYFYDFAAQDNTKDYFFRADGGVTLADHERYQSASNSLDQVNSQLEAIKTETNKILKIEANRLKIDSTLFTLTIYEDDGTTPAFVFDLKDSTGVATATNIFERVPV